MERKEGTNQTMRLQWILFPFINIHNDKIHPVSINKEN